MKSTDPIIELRRQPRESSGWHSTQRVDLVRSQLNSELETRASRVPKEVAPEAGVRQQAAERSFHVSLTHASSQTQGLRHVSSSLSTTCERDFARERVNPHLNVDLRTIPETIRATIARNPRAFALAHPLHGRTVEPAASGEEVVHGVRPVIACERRKELDMAKKRKVVADRGGDQLASMVRGSAQQIWLAGLGAFSKTQEEGAKVFDALVKEGKTLEARTRKVAEAKVSEVGRALSQVGESANRELQAIAKRVETLTASVQNLTRAGKRRAAAKKR
jgi:poly(hydroxyalkanoate) granule-associated protein